MKDAQKPDHVSLITLISRLREGRFVIPDFQREFEWEPWDISALMRSIFLDYYIGSLLFWKGKAENFEALACEPIYGFKNGNGKPEYIVLDGQQRLTAMYYAFMAPDISAPRRRNRFIYFIRVDQFIEEAYDDAFDYDWTRRGINLLQNKKLQFEKHMFPLSVIGKGGWELANWVQGYIRYWEEKAEKAKQQNDDIEEKRAKRYAEYGKTFGEHIKEITEQYQVAYIELDRELSLDKVCDIFTQINSRGIRLDVFDLFNALLRPKGIQLRLMWREAAPRLNFVETERMNVYILQVMSILRQAYCSPKYLYYLLPGQERQLREPDGSLRKEILVKDTREFLALWEQAIEAMERAINLIRHPQQFGAIAPQFLPYVSILPAFAALQTEVQKLPAVQRLDAQRKIRQWYWASVFTNRYSGAVESTSAKDFIDVKAWFNDDNAEPGLITEFRERFRNIDFRKETRRGTSVYNGVFNLLILNGAKDWITGNVLQYDDIDDHHIIPRSWGFEQKIGADIDSILNRSPLTSETNRNVINDRLPNVYLQELIEANGEEMIKEILESHLITPAAMEILLRDPFTREDFEAFLLERQRAIQQAIEELLVKARLDLSPGLRELDAAIEKIELSLRRLIDTVLQGKDSLLPEHVKEKIEGRLQIVARKNPAFDTERYQTLEGKLEYADLRELQDIITNRALWGSFQKYFVNKETLVKRFDQLAELRNGIRHSRTVDDITRKEGEAAVEWFKQVLKK